MALLLAVLLILPLGTARVAAPSRPAASPDPVASVRWAVSPDPVASAHGAASPDPVALLHPVAGLRPAAGLGPVARLRAAGYRWPLAPPSVLRRFDPPAERWLPGHRGVDLGASPGATIRSAGPGVVIFAGRVAGRGVISVAHAGGLRTTYEPVTAAVTAGDRIAAGDRLGTIEIGHLGCPEPVCLHWGLRRGGDYLDPLALLGLGRVRLLPL
ncbi:peptidoglycan DD-metalloendopeptidase family protein [Actinoplanes missouriensis]|uniref:M23 family metallopeptidase n=1 Tax=Actinoplanes missouriensis TaxID=1866 RepID=UPI0033D00C67